MLMNRKRIYMRLIDEPPIDGAAEDQLSHVRETIEGLAPLRWENGYPQVHSRGGWSAVFYVNQVPTEETFNRWIAQLEQCGYRPCI